MLSENLLFIVPGTSIWVLIDAQTIGVKKKAGSGLFNMGPLGWFISCLLVWIIAFPAYIAKRPKFRSDERKENIGLGIVLFLMAVFYLVAPFLQSSLTVNLTGLPRCDSEEFRESFVQILRDKSDIEVIGNLRSLHNSLTLPRERMSNEHTGEVVSACAVLAKTDKGRKAFSVSVSQDGEGKPVYFEYQEMDYTTFTTLLSAAAATLPPESAVDPAYKKLITKMYEPEVICLADMVDAAYLRQGSPQAKIDDILAIAYTLKNTVSSSDDPSYCRYAKIASGGRYKSTSQSPEGDGDEFEHLQGMRALAESVIRGEAVDSTCNATAFARPNERIEDKGYQGMVLVGKRGHHLFYATKEDYSASGC